MSGANFASLHGGMLQRSDLPAEKAAHPKKVSTPDGVYGATGVANHLSDEITTKKVVGVDRRDALPSKFGGRDRQNKIPTKELDASSDLSKTPINRSSPPADQPPVRANPPVAMNPPVPANPPVAANPPAAANLPTPEPTSKGPLQIPTSRGPLQAPAPASKSSRLVQALRGVPATHLGTPEDTTDEDLPAADHRSKSALPFQRGFGRQKPDVADLIKAAQTADIGTPPTSVTQENTPQDATPSLGVLTAREKTKRKALTVRLLPSEYSRLKRAGTFLDRTSQDILVSAMDEYLKQLGFTHEK